MPKKNIICVGLCLLSFLNLILPVSADDSNSLIANEDFNEYNIGTYSSQVSRSEWAVATASNAHKVEIISESDTDKALQLTVGTNGSSGVSVYRRGLAISKSMLVREKITVSDTNRRIVFRLYDDNTASPVFAVQMLNGNIIAMNGAEEKNVATYRVNTEYTLEMRVNTDCDENTDDTYDLYIDGNAVALEYKMPRNIKGNIKQIELCEAPAWATDGTSIIDDFYVEYYTPVVRELEEITASVPSEELAIGAKMSIKLSGTMSDGSKANLSNAEISYKSSNEDVAAVDDEGNITAVSDGTATVTITVKMGNVKLSETIEISVIYLNHVNIISDDFESYDEGDFTNQIPKGYSVNNLSGYFPMVIEKDNEGNKALRFVMEDLTGTVADYLTGKNTMMRVDGLSLSGPFSVKERVKISSFGNSARCFPFMLYDTAGTRALTLCIRNGKLSAENGSASIDLKEGLSVNKWYEIELVVYHDADINTTDLYDVYLDGELLKEGLKVQSELGEISSITCVENTNYAPFSVYVDNIGITSIRYPKIEKICFKDGKDAAGAEGVSPNTDKLVLKFNNVMVQTSACEKVKIYSGENEIPCEFNYDEKEKSLIANFLEKLSENTTYQVKVEKGIRDIDGLETFCDYVYEFKTGEFDYSSQISLKYNGEEIKELVSGQDLDLIVSVKNNTKLNKSAVVIKVQYDADVRMISYTVSPVTLIAEDVTEVSEKIEMASSAKYLGVYIWESIDEQKHICREVIFPKDGLSKEAEEENEAITVKVKDYDEIVEIKGNVGDIEDKSVTLLVYSPSGEIVQIRQTDTDMKGNFAFFVPFEENVVLNSAYKAVVKGSKLVTGEFVCRGKSYAVELMKEILNADAEDLFDIITQNSEYFDVNLKKDSEYDALSQRAKNELWQSIADSDIQKPDELAEKINENIKKQQILDNMWEELSKSQNGEEVIAVFEKYSEYIGIDLEAPYGYKLCDTDEKKALGGLFIGKTFSDTNELKEYFEEQTLLSLLNNKSWKLIEDVISNNKDMLKVEFSSEYKKLHEIDKADFLKELVGLTFDSIDEFKSEFTKKLATLKLNEANKPSSSGGGSGSSGGSGSGKGDVVYSIKAEIQQNATIPDVSKEDTAFSDVPRSHWAYEYIKGMNEKKLVSGYTDGTFKPDKNITRAEFMKLIVDSFGLFDENARADFLDMPKDSWYYKYVASAVNAGIIKGYSDGSIGGNHELTRQDMAVIICRVAEGRGIIAPTGVESTGFSDNEQIADYAVEAVVALCEKGVISGVGNNTFMPNGNTTRAMAAKVIYMILQEVV